MTDSLTTLIPMRLGQATRELAQLALSGAWGRALAETTLSLDGRAEFALLSAEMRYAQCVKLIAEEAPLRIFSGMWLVGSASLRQASCHELPVRCDGRPAFSSTSHLTLGFDQVLKVGYRGLRARVEERLATGELDERGTDLLQAMQVCLDAAAIWHQRYLDELTVLAEGAVGEERARLLAIYDNLRLVPELPPENFTQAVQALWFLFAFQRLCGNWPGIGRIDAMLGEFLARDLASGAITLDEAREMLAHFWIHGCEWIGAPNSFGGSGDAQYYQNIVLAGVDAEGNDLINEVTYLVLDVVEELHISDFPIAVRLNSHSPERLLRRIAEVQRHGSGIVAVYNDEVVIPALVEFGYPIREARRYANDGCWEVQIPGETCFSYRPFDMLALLQEILGITTEDEPPAYADFDALYAAFYHRLARQIAEIHRDADTFALGGPPSTLVSLLEQDCIARGRGYYDRGARYNVYAPHAGGLPDTGNNLFAIQKIVYE